MRYASWVGKVSGFLGRVKGSVWGWYQRAMEANNNIHVPRRLLGEGKE
jgi:hypothetical protein